MKPTLSTLAAAYARALACFLALDASWLATMCPRLYRPALGALMAPVPDWRAAAAFYALYLLGLVVLAVAPALERRDARVALRRGALLGLVAYATYDLTNQATLRGWPWTITLADLAWGTLASGSAAWVAARFTSRPGSRTGGR